MTDNCRICLSPSVKSSHFGVKACKPCAAFFRRTITLNLGHKCIGSGKCIVHFERRIICRSCRYEKCLTNNMNPIFVRSRMAAMASSLSDPTTSQTLRQVEKTSKYSDDKLQETISYYTKMMFDLNMRRKVLHTRLELDDVFATECEMPYNLHTIQEYNCTMSSFRADVAVLLDYIKGFPDYDKFSREEKGLWYRYTSLLDYILNCANYSTRIGLENKLFVMVDGRYVKMDPPPLPIDEAIAAGRVFTEEGENYYRTLIPAILTQWSAVVLPFDKLKMTFVEFVLFKALVCWHIGSTKFSPETRKTCDANKNVLFEALLSCNSNSDLSPEERLGELLLFMGSILEVVHNQINDFVMITTFNFMRYDPLMSEICNYKKW